MAPSPEQESAPTDPPRCPWCGGPMRERDPLELARLHVPSRDWSTLTCDRCDRTTLVRN